MSYSRKTAASPEIHLYVILSCLLQQWLLHSTDIFTNMTQFSRYVYTIIWSTRSTKDILQHFHPSPGHIKHPL